MKQDFQFKGKLNWHTEIHINNKIDENKGERIHFEV